MSHESRLTQVLRELLNTSRVAALGTCNPDGTPFVSMVPFAIEPQGGAIVIHVSALAPHTGNLQSSPAVSLLVMQAETVGEAVHALPRVSLDGTAHVLTDHNPALPQARRSYLKRFPEAEPMVSFGDFVFVTITVTTARQVAGFGAARTLDAQEIAQVLQGAA